MVSWPVLSIWRRYRILSPMFSVIAVHPFPPETTALDNVPHHPLMGTVDSSDALKVPLKPLIKLPSRDEMRLFVFPKLLFSLQTELSLKQQKERIL